MAGLIVAALVMTVALILLLARLDLRKFLGYSAIVDVCFTVLMFMMFMGTFSGIVAGAFAGLFMTLLLYMLKAVLGYKKLERRGLKLVWVQYPAKFSL